MKFHWFAEATYPHLPADFAEKYRTGSADSGVKPSSGRLVAR